MTYYCGEFSTADGSYIAFKDARLWPIDPKYGASNKEETLKSIDDKILDLSKKLIPGELVFIDRRIGFTEINIYGHGAERTPMRSIIEQEIHETEIALVLEKKISSINVSSDGYRAWSISSFFPHALVESDHGMYLSRHQGDVMIFEQDLSRRKQFIKQENFSGVQQISNFKFVAGNHNVHLHLLLHYGILYGEDIYDEIIDRMRSAKNYY